LEGPKSDLLKMLMKRTNCVTKSFENEIGCSLQKWEDDLNQYVAENKHVLMLDVKA